MFVSNSCWLYWKKHYLAPCALGSLLQHDMLLISYLWEDHILKTLKTLLDITKIAIAAPPDAHTQMCTLWHFFEPYFTQQMIALVCCHWMKVVEEIWEEIILNEARMRGRAKINATLILAQCTTALTGKCYLGRKEILGHNLLWGQSLNVSCWSSPDEGDHTTMFP